MGAGKKARKKEKKEGWEGGREKRRMRGGREGKRKEGMKEGREGGKKAAWTGYITQWQSFCLVMFENPWVPSPSPGNVGVREKQKNSHAGFSLAL